MYSFTSRCGIIFFLYCTVSIFVFTASIANGRERSLWASEKVIPPKPAGSSRRIIKKATKYSAVTPVGIANKVEPGKGKKEKTGAEKTGIVKTPTIGTPPASVVTPGTTAKPSGVTSGTTAKPSGVKPGTTAVKPGTTSKPGGATPGTTSKPGITTKPGTAALAGSTGNGKTTTASKPGTNSPAIVKPGGKKVTSTAGGATSTAGGATSTSKKEEPKGSVEVPSGMEKIEAVDKSLIGKPGVIYKGSIPVSQFLRFIANYKGEPVLYDSVGSTTYFDKEIKLESQTVATYEVVKAILEANDFVVVERTLSDRTPVIEVMNSKRRISHIEATPIIEEKGEKPLLEGIKPDEVATLVVKLEYAEAKDIQQTISSILGTSTKGTTGGGMTIITVDRTNTLIFKAKYSLMEYIRKLVKLLDVELPEEKEETIEIIDVKEADASDLANLIDEVLSGSNQNRNSSINSRSINSRYSSSSRSRSSGISSLSSSYRSRNQMETILIPEERTQRIVVVSTNEREVELVMYLAEALDQQVSDPRHKTHIYQVKYLTAVDVADVLSNLIGTSNRTGLSGRTSGTSRTSSSFQRNSSSSNLNSRRSSSRFGSTGSSFGSDVTRIVPHEQTNSLLIQAEPEEYAEILHILKGIDRKRNQVFLEAALVQVSENSSLNYTIELLAGNLDDKATRVAAISSFGLSTVDPSLLPSTFDRLILDSAASPGLTSVISRNGQIPALVKFLKGNNESQVVATPFILADDNEQNQIQIITTTYVMTQQTVGTQSVIAEPKGEDAGVTLSITPTISQNAVLLDLHLEVSEFAKSATVTGNLPDKTQNLIEGRVSVPDGELFVIGGLTSESKSVSVDKVPILGDIPLLGILFQSKSNSTRRSNLYVFLTAHVLTDRSFRDIEHLTREAEEGVKSYKGTKDIKLQHFTNPPVFEESSKNNSSELNQYNDLTPINPYEKKVK